MLGDAIEYECGIASLPGRGQGVYGSLHGACDSRRDVPRLVTGSGATAPGAGRADRSMYTKHFWMFRSGVLGVGRYVRSTAPKKRSIFHLKHQPGLARQPLYLRRCAG
jgi:hypothetical protein